MKPFQKVLGIIIISLITVYITITVAALQSGSDVLLITAHLLMVPAWILTAILMSSYKNRLLRKVFLWGMPGFLILYFIAHSFSPSEFLNIITLVFYVYMVLVNLVIYFLRNDLNLIVMTFLLIIGLLFKHFHLPLSGLIVMLSILTSSVFTLIIAIRALRIKENRYLSMVIFSCGLILAMTYISFAWKIQHWPGAGFLNMVVVPIFIISTLIVLLTLPGSNFIEWKKQQKRTLIRGLLVPWLFVIYIVATTVLIPPYDQFKPFFFFKDNSQDAAFKMEDYPVENRNGLE